MPNLNPEGVEEIRKVVEAKGLPWVIAAMIDGSIGYHSARSAELMVNYTLKGVYWGCERTGACFGNDPVEEILHDIRYFQHVEEESPEKVKAVIAFAEATKDLSWVERTTAGLMYPTTGP